jgi:hypothetical protein
MVRTDGIAVKHLAGCSKRPSSKAAGEPKPEAYPLGYVEDFDEQRTKLAGFFSILQDRGFREWRTWSSAPDDAFLIEEVIDHFDAIAHLDLRLFGHGEDGTDQLA